MMRSAIRASRPTTAILAAIGILSLITSGCIGLRRVVDYKKQGIQSRAISRIEGRIETEGPVEGVLVVILGRLVETEPNLVGVDSYVRETSGSYVFGVSPGRFQVGAYEDRNRNGLLDPGERAIRVRKGEILEVGPGERARFDLHLPTGSVLEDLTEPVDVLAIIERTPHEQREFSLWAFSAQGTICEDLGDEKFGPTSGPRGLWEPMNFLNDELAGIYFLEAYDPTRIPVLFVHGIAGFPQEFTTLIEGLDRERFQAWFYFYPSGFPLNGLSNHLQEMLERIQTKQRFKQMAIVAHSMGGLVARGAILKYADNTDRDDIRFFLSISTPFGGDASAVATQDAPIELPASFADMSPSSDYLRWIFYRDEARERLKTLPENVEYHMIMGFRMKKSGNVANDRKVAMWSQARFEAQEEALSIRAWDYDHWSILKSPEAVARMNRLLERRFR